MLYVLVYVLWLVNAAACAMAVIQLRATVNALWVILGGEHYALGLVNQLVLILGSLAALVYVIVLESHYRESIAPSSPRPGVTGGVSEKAPPVRPGRLPPWLTGGGLDVLLRRFAITTAVPLAIVALSLLVLEIALRGLP